MKFNSKRIDTSIKTTLHSLNLVKPPISLDELVGGSLQADHLCILIHGLWGNPIHMTQIAKSLRDQFDTDSLYLHATNGNCGSFTYDGIDLGGERICHEVEQLLADIEAKGGKIKKISFIGYSLGGLLARYVVGLLYAKGILDQLECMNFVTFASPHLGVRTPSKGWHNHIWNVLGARTLSMSGRQLFMIDTFRDTDKPLLRVLADPESIFIKALTHFKRRTLYSNIVNDKAAVHYTTSISKTDPFVHLDSVKVHFYPGYEDVLLDPAHPATPRMRAKEAISVRSAALWACRAIGRVFVILGLTLIAPIGVVAFLTNSLIQQVLSSQRISRHERGQAGIDLDAYRLPVWIRSLRKGVEETYESLNNAEEPSYLVDGDSEHADGDSDSSPEGSPGHRRTDSLPRSLTAKYTERSSATATRTAEPGTQSPSQAPSRTPSPTAELPHAPETSHGRVSDAHRRRRLSKADEQRLVRERRASVPEQPTLALTADQFAMIEALNALGWQKWNVWVHRTSYSHAAMIYRVPTADFEEGLLVLRHFATEAFLA